MTALPQRRTWAVIRAAWRVKALCEAADMGLRESLEELKAGGKLEAAEAVERLLAAQLAATAAAGRSLE